MKLDEALLLLLDSLIAFSSCGERLMGRTGSLKCLPLVLLEVPLLDKSSGADFWNYFFSP